MSAGFKVVSVCWNKSEQICVSLFELYIIIIYEFFWRKDFNKRWPPVGTYPFFIVTQQERHYPFYEI